MSTRYVGLAACLLLAACGGGGGGGTSTPPPGGSTTPPPTVTSLSVAGAVQKGPFLVGSTVLVNKLDAQGRPTDSTVVTEIKDSIGSFSFTTSSAGPVQIVASGYYFSELTGNVSNGTLTLKALYDVGSTATQTAYVNLMTHLINDRVLQLMSGSQLTFNNAIAQAEREFIAAFGPALPVSGFDDFAALSVYNVAGTSEVGNAYLLALSTGFYKYAELRAAEFGSSVDAELTLILNQISDDLADDGEIEQAEFFDDFIDAIRSLSPTEIAANLRRRSIVDYPAGLGVPDISRFLNQCAGATECAWSNGAPMPAVSRGHAAVRFDDKLYVFGGTTPADSPEQSWPYLDPPPPTAFRWTRVYDPVANSWTEKAPMPVGGYVVNAHRVGDKIYVLPGYGLNGFRNEVLEYDPVADTWATKTPSPTYRYTVSTEVVNDKIYVLGGDGVFDDGPWVQSANWTIKSHVEIYDPATDSWSTGQSAPAPFSTAATCAIGDEIYMFGGADANRQRIALTQVYNASTNSWSTKASLPTARSNATCARVGDQLYVIGGWSGALVDSVDRYDPATDSWTSVTRLLEPRHYIEAEPIDSKIFMLGGELNGQLVDTVEIFDTSL
jgi:N-acetylneuraminic acid mutarotase